MSMGAERRGGITGCRTRATRPPPAVQRSRARLQPFPCPILRREDVEFLGRKPETGDTPTPPGLISCVTGDPTASDSAKRPPKRPEWPESGLPALDRVGGEHDPDGCHPVGQGPIHGRILKPTPVTAKFPAWRSHEGSRRPDRRPRRGYARPWPPRRGSGVGASRRPPLPWRAGNAGVRGGAAPRQPRSGTRGVWPQRVCWLVSETRLGAQLPDKATGRGSERLLALACAKEGPRDAERRNLVSLWVT